MRNIGQAGGVITGGNLKGPDKSQKPIIRYAIISTRIGRFFVAATEKGICRTHFPSSRKLLESVERSYDCELVEVPGHFRDIARQLRSYFSGNLREFDCKLDFVKGTDFQKKVWKTLLKIPYGEVRSYKWVAEQVGCPKAFRAVGGANHNNPIPIIVPCHRVIGSDGSMVGYGGPSKEGQERKRELLRMEGAID